MKKMIALLLALVLAMGLVPASLFSASAADALSGSCGPNAVWTFDPGSGTLTVSGAGGMDDYYYSNPQPWKPYLKEITSVVVTPGITAVGSGAFDNCRRLKSVSLPNGLNTIDSHAFACCQALEAIDVPDSVTAIESSAFGYCTSLKQISLSNALQKLGTSAFSDCGSLEQMVLPKTLTKMEPKSVFSGCDSIRSFTVASENPAFSSDSAGILYDKDKTKLLLSPRSVAGSVSVLAGVREIGATAFAGCSELTAVSLPDTVTDIGVSAFSGCSRLCSVSIGSGAERIGAYAFSDCKALAQISLSQKLKSIDKCAFSYCIALKHISLPSSLESIGNGAFGNTGLTGTLTIPTNLKSLGDYAFENCPNLQRFQVEANNLWFSNDDAGVLFDCGKTVLLCCPELLSGSYSVPSSVHTIKYCAFANCSSMTAIILPEGLEYIGDSAFRMCSALTELAFPASLRAESCYDYYGCFSLERYAVAEGNPYFASDESGLLYNKNRTTLLRCPQHYCGACELPEGVVSGESDAFLDCRHVTSLYLPASWTNDSFAFGCMPALQTISVSDGNPCLRSQNGTLYSKDMTELICCPAGYTGVCEVAAAATVIRSLAFDDCKKLEAVHLPNGLKEIGMYAFFGCESMKRVTVPASVTSIGMRAFGYYDPECERPMKGMSFTNVKGFAIFGYRNTAAEAYADKEYFDFYDLDEYVEGKTEFDDVHPSDYYAQPVHWAVWRGVTVGTGNGLFSPDAACTRAEIVTMLWRALGSPAPEAAQCPFEDVDPNAWYAGAVRWALKAGVTSGTSASTFSPNEPCTRSQAITFLWKASPWQYEDALPATQFTDVAEDAWYARAVRWAVGNHISAGTSATTFSPDQICTRAQIVTFLWQTKENVNRTLGRP